VRRFLIVASFIAAKKTTTLGNGLSPNVFGPSIAHTLQQGEENHNRRTEKTYVYVAAR
jgi:hypothetical protein